MNFADNKERSKTGGKSIELQQQYMASAKKEQDKHHSFGEKSPQYLKEIMKGKNSKKKITRSLEKYIDNSSFKEEIETILEPFKIQRKRKHENCNEIEQDIKRKKEDLKNKIYAKTDVKTLKSKEIRQIETNIENLKMRIASIRRENVEIESRLKDEISTIKIDIQSLQFQQQTTKEELIESEKEVITEIEKIIGKDISEIK